MDGLSNQIRNPYFSSVRAVPNFTSALGDIRADQDSAQRRLTEQGEWTIQDLVDGCQCLRRRVLKYPDVTVEI